MKNKEIRKKALRLFNDNLSLIAFMALMLALFQVAVSVASVITFEAVGANTIVSMLSMFVTAPITICMYNVYSLLIRGNVKIKKSYLFEWLGDFNLVWHSIKVQLMYAFKLVPWALLVAVGGSFVMTLLTGYAEILALSETVQIIVMAIFFVIALLFLVYQSFRYQGGLFECAAVPMKIITPIFHIGMVKMKYNLKDYIKLMLSYMPLIILFSAPVLIYELFIMVDYDAIYYALLVFETVGTSFVVNPLIGISGMIRYNVGGKIPPEHFFQSFGMKRPKEYGGEVNTSGEAEKPEITDPEPIPREEKPSQPGNISDIPFDNAPSSEDEEEQE